MKKYLFKHLVDIASLVATIISIALASVITTPPICISLAWFVVIIIAAGAFGWFVGWLSFLHKRKKSFYRPGMVVRCKVNGRLCTIVKRHPFRRAAFICEHDDGKQYVYDQSDFILLL